MEYFPPPLFKQGPSARVRLTFFVTVSLALFIVDAHFGATKTIRQIIGTGLYPLQQIATLPIRVGRDVLGYVRQVAELKLENEALVQQKLVDQEKLHRYQILQTENEKLRHLLKIANSLQVKRTIIAEIISDANDPFSHKVIINKGSLHGVQEGMPVIDELGLQGQVTLTYPAKSEISLITDKEQIVPVESLRTGFRTILHGGVQGGQLELRFTSANADIQPNDLLVTSGLDKLYPRGIPVARVVSVSKSPGSHFLQIVCQPIAGVDKHRFLLILETSAPPEDTESDTPKPQEAPPNNQPTETTGQG